MCEFISNSEASITFGISIFSICYNIIGILLAVSHSV